MKRVRPLLPLAAALLGTLLLQWPALRAPFFADDWLFLDQARGRALGAALASPDPIGNFFRPLGRVLWFWTLGRASGESAFAFHLANLLLWLAAVTLLWALARRVAGERAAAVAAGVFAVTYAADVPVLWASGAQDLLALALALGALLAVSHGRMRAAALLLFAAPFAKETAAVALVPALLLARRDGEGPAALARRAWPLAAAVLGYAALAAWVVTGRHVPGSGLALTPWGPLAALADVVRVALGLEWRAQGAPWVPFVFPGGRVLAGLALAGGAVALSAARAGGAKAPAPAAERGSRKAPRRAAPSAPPRSAPHAEPPAAPRSAWLVAVAWIVAGAAPVALVAPLWSAYYLLFAMAGVALLAGLATARASGGVAAAVVLAAGLAAHQARALDEFATAPDPWAGQSHVSRFYLERGMQVMRACADDLLAARPKVPPHSTFFLAGVPSFAAIQVADGPLVRGLYRDPTLHSHFVSAFRREVLSEGPVYMFFYDAGERRLVDRTDDPQMWFSLGLGYLLNGRPELALEALRLELQRAPGSPTIRYAIAIAHAAAGDSAAARPLLVELGMSLTRDSGALGAACERAFVARDSSAARELAEVARTRAAFDPVPHLVLSRIGAASRETSAMGVLEAAAAVAFAPGSAPAWRNWGAVQRQMNHLPEAFASLERYFELDPAAERDDPEAVAWREALRQMQPGGLTTQRAMKGDLTPR